MHEIVVSASEANRSFSRILRLVREGAQVRVTSHGETVARIVPPADEDTAERQRRQVAMTAWLDRLESQPIVRIEPWTRDELYERENWKKWEP